MNKENTNTKTDAARACDSTGAQLLRDFMRGYVMQRHTAVDYDAWFHRQVQAGLDAADAGALMSHEDVEAEAAAWRSEILRKRQGSVL